MTELFAVLILGGLLLLGFVLQQNGKKKGSKLPYPPGPGILESVYHLILFRDDVQKVSARWAEKYGDLVKVRCLFVNATIVNTLQANKAILGQNAGAGRLKAHNLAQISGGFGFGIVNSDGKNWAEARKQSLSLLARYGFGREESEAIIIHEADVVRDWIIDEMKRSPKGIYIHHVFDPIKLCASSTIWQMITSKRLTPESHEIYDLMNHFLHAVQVSSGRGLLFFPWIRHVFPKWTYFGECVKRSKAIHKFVGEEFDRHKETFQEGKMRDLMDSYIKILGEVSDPQSAFYGERGHRNAIASMVDMLVATWDSISGSVIFALVLVASHPEVQKKLHEEIDRVLGRDTPPSSATKKSMPYLEATVEESFRMSSIAPWGMPHQAMEDIEYNGYKIDKGDMLICNVHRVHHNPKTWGDPEVFRPERFLGENGKELKKYVIPFMTGKRVCPGAPLSYETVHIFLARILQKLELHMDPDTPKEKYLETEMWIAQMPKNVKIIYKERAS